MKRFYALLLSLAVTLAVLVPAANATLFIPTAGETQMAGVILKGTAADAQLDLKLFTDAGSFVAADTWASRTELSGCTGYTSGTGKPLTAGTNWTTTGGQPIVETYTAQTWTFGGACTTIKGYAVVGHTSGVLYWEELLTVPFTPANNGDSLTITPRFQLQ